MTIDTARTRNVLHIDIETRSVIDLGERGVYVYVEHPSTDILILCYALNDGPVSCWYMHWGMPMPDDLRQWMLDPSIELAAHNSSFERTLLLVTGRKYLSADIIKAIAPAERWTCTATRAAAAGLPRSLDGAATALRLPIQKDKEGYNLMLQMCFPRKFHSDGTLDWLEDPDSILRLASYCAVDVLVEQRLDQVLPDLSEKEKEVWHATTRMNDRGIQVDGPFVERMVEFVREAEEDVNQHLARITNGTVTKVTQAQRLMKWLNTQDTGDETKKITLENLGKNTLKDLLNAHIDYEAEVKKNNDNASVIDDAILDGDQPDYLKAIILRKNGGKSSAGKFKSAVSRKNKDNRIRGTMFYCGAASTGRFSSRGTQLQNLPRGNGVKGLKSDEAIEAILDGASVEDITRDYGMPILVASDLVRPSFVSKPGFWLARGDYSQIEARVSAWLGNQKNTLDAFRDYDTFTGEFDKKGKPIRLGPDIYKITARDIVSLLFGTTAITDITDDQRQTFGKVPVLACIAEDELVLTDRGLVPIQNVSTSMKVWDGVEWVSHLGPIFKGYQDCITYDGLTATRDHQVFVENSAGTIAFGEAADRSIRLNRAGLEGTTSWNNHGYERHDHSLPRIRPEERYETCSVGAVPEMQGPADMETLGPDSQRCKQRMSIVQASRDPDLSLASEASGWCQGAMYEPQEQSMEGLWRPWNPVRVREREGSSGMVHEQPPNAGEAHTLFGVRQDRQRQGLCTGEPSSHNARGEYYKSSHYLNGGLRRHYGSSKACTASVSISEPQYSILGRDSETSTYRVYVGVEGDRTLEFPCERFLQTRRPVWDILEAGPRNRFTVSGRLVHNCGFGGGPHAFAAFAKLYGVHISEDQQQTIVNAFRDANPGLRAAWWVANRAARECMMGEPGEMHFIATRDGDEKLINPGTGKPLVGSHVIPPIVYFKRSSICMTMCLPSGRKLAYWYPKLEERDAPWGKVKSVSFKSLDSQSNQWWTFHGYGGLWFQNAVQAIARDVAAESFVELDRNGFNPVLLVHDEAVTEVSRDRFPNHKDAANAVGDIMTRKVLWLPDCPIAVDSSAGLRYVKG